MEGWRCGSVVECILSVCKALGLTVSNKLTTKYR
jgi:hypothetical protein